jgi:hypothetical protein
MQSDNNALAAKVLTKAANHAIFFTTFADAHAPIKIAIYQCYLMN